MSRDLVAQVQQYGIAPADAQNLVHHYSNDDGVRGIKTEGARQIAIILMCVAKGVLGHDLAGKLTRYAQQNDLTVMQDLYDRLDSVKHDSRMYARFLARTEQMLDDYFATSDAIVAATNMTIGRTISRPIEAPEPRKRWWER